MYSKSKCILCRKKNLKKINFFQIGLFCLHKSINICPTVLFPTTDSASKTCNILGGLVTPQNKDSLNIYSFLCTVRVNVYCVGKKI